MSASAYDVAVVGAGHNGLVAANYLARAGRRVIVLEARDVVGGACVSEELIGGSQWSSCAFIAGLLRPEIVADLELKRYGLEMYQSDVLSFSLFRDGSHMFLWKELDKTLREIERYSTADAQSFLDFGLRLRRFADLVRPYLLQPAPTRSELMRVFEDAGEADLFNEFVLISAKDLLDRYFESEHLKGLLTFFGMVSIWGGPSTPGTSYVYGHHSWGEFNGEFGQYGFVKGGMGGITQALANAARDKGVEIRLSSPVSRVLVRNGAAAGVVLDSGDEIAAKLVVSNADPKRSLLGLVDPGELDDDFVARVEQIDLRGSMARIHLLIDELPAYLGFDATDGPQHHGHQMLGASVENFEATWEAQRRGEIPDSYVIEAVIQSSTDPTLAPDGKHTLTLGVQQLPYELSGGRTWDDVKDSWADKVVAELCEYAPNLKDHILDRAVITPLDLERDYLITEGNIFHGQMYLDQLFDARPAPGISDYRTPIDNYYLCGVGTHPGGGVMGASGHNAAQAILADAGGRPAAAPTRTGDQGSKGVIDRIMETDTGRKAGYRLARHKAFRPIVRRASRRKEGS